MYFASEDKNDVVSNYRFRTYNVGLILKAYFHIYIITTVSCANYIQIGSAVQLGFCLLEAHTLTQPTLKSPKIPEICIPYKKPTFQSSSVYFRKLVS